MASLRLCVLLLISAFAVSAQLRVVEDGVRMKMANRELHVSMPVEGDLTKTLKGKLTVRSLDNRGLNWKPETFNVNVGPQNKLINFTLAVGTDYVEDLIWRRLDYTLEIGGRTAGGVISFSQMLDGMFQLNALSNDRASGSSTLIYRVRSTEPLTGKTVAGVELKGVLFPRTDDEEDKRKFEVRVSAYTDADGYAELVFKLPDGEEIAKQRLTVEIDGEMNGLRARILSGIIPPNMRIKSFYMLDKPLYQPGQKVQFRTLLMRGSENGAGFIVAPDEKVTFKIKDESGLTLYKNETKATRFGIASGEWTLPPDAKLGQYRIELETTDGAYGLSTSFKVSRYELPNFVVKAKSDKTFYLEDSQAAEVKITAQYLFGKPVTGGHVKIVLERSRYWNWWNQNWSADASDVVEGDADASGEYSAKIPFEMLQNYLYIDEQRKSRDLTFVAYFTDPTSNRTEEGRFDIRVSKQPIHVYVEPGRNVNPNLPLETIVRTLRADGEPCACDFVLRGRSDADKDAAKIEIARGRTDAKGNAAVIFRTPKAIVDGTGNLELSVDASQDDDAGSDKKIVRLDRGANDVAVRTDKALYQPGQPIRVTVDAVGDESVVFIDVASQGLSLARRRGKLVSGRFEVVIPYSDRFKGELNVTAMVGVETDLIRAARRSTRVVYPKPAALNVVAKTEYSEYRPGVEASLKLGVAGENRASQETALGVTIIDRAVEERAQAENGGRGNLDLLGSYRLLSGSSWADNIPTKVSPDLQLQARSSLRFGKDDQIRTSSTGWRSLFDYHKDYIETQFRGVREYLAEYNEKTLQYPKDADQLARVLALSGKYDFSKMLDPWGRPYRVRLRAENVNHFFELVSEGPDKRPDTADQFFKDDFVAFRTYFHWFRATGTLIDLAIAEYTTKTGKYVTDLPTLKDALKARGIDFDALRDPWGLPLRAAFRIQGRYLLVVFHSAGPDLKFDANPDQYYSYNSTDVFVWGSRTDYYKTLEAQIGAALRGRITAKKSFPASVEEFKSILSETDVAFEAFRDPFGQPLAVSYYVNDVYADRVAIEKRPATDGSKPRTVFTITPVTRKLGVFSITNVADRNQSQRYIYAGQVGRFTGIVSEQSREDAKPRLIEPRAVLSDGRGAIFGLVTNPNGGAVSGVSVVAKKLNSKFEKTAYSDGAGIVVLEGLEPGKYVVEFTANWYKKLKLEGVEVGFDDVVTIAASVDEPDAVNSGGFSLDGASSMDSLSASVSITSSEIEELPFNGRRLEIVNELQRPPSRQADSPGGEKRAFMSLRTDEDVAPDDGEARQTDTPCVREYFPETLLWIPEIVTDANGKASVKFKLGDNITTWNVYAVASDAKGRVGLAKSEFKTFQPFFVDLDAPKYLTVGDEIKLPTQVRNYTAAAKKVDLSMLKTDWFEFLGADRQTVDAAANATTNGIFGFRATRAVDGGRQRVTALAGKENDAVEKPVTVRPDGEEIVATETTLVSGKDTLRLDYPENALAATPKAVLRIYPNMIGHVVEAIDGLLVRPYGCAEQTISSTYPNLMLLKLASKSKGATSISSELQAKSRRNLKQGYERLLGYQHSNGAFGYWGSTDTPDVALTAYAVRFLLDAQSEIEVDPSVVDRAASFLVNAMRPDGSFAVKYPWEKDFDARRTFMTTSYVARILGKYKAARPTGNIADAALAKSLEFMKFRGGVMYEPYTLALYGLTALDAGLTDEAAATAALLRENAVSENDSVYWNLETNTPFYGWGTPGRVETTALVLQFLQRAGEPRDKKLIGSAMMFLLRNKDRYGVWYSTQTTINVLDAFAASFGVTGARTIKLRYNGRELDPVAIAEGRIEPIRIELPVDASKGTLEIDAGDANAQLMAQVVRTHYVAWKDSTSTNRNDAGARAVKLDYSCDKTSAKVTETVICTVSAERIGFKGYGMLLAEIGLPPGADVARDTLETARQREPSLSRYEVRPDRIVFYMWAKPGGTKFEFKFRPRYAIKAKTPASLLYDYYNEEARAVVAPVTFDVR